MMQVEEGLPIQGSDCGYVRSQVGPTWSVTLSRGRGVRVGVVFLVVGARVKIVSSFILGRSMAALETEPCGGAVYRTVARGL